MAADWIEHSIHELVEIKHGYAFKGEFFRDSPPGDILLTPRNFAIGGGFQGDKLKYYDGPVPDEFVLAEGDLLVTMTDLSKNADTLGFPARPARMGAARYLHNQRLGKVVARDTEVVDLEFLHYLMCTRGYRSEIVAGATGTTVKHTSPSRIGQHRFFLPALSEQRAIASILGALDDKIDLNRRMNATLEAMARAIFKSWFMDLDPVRAKAEGRQPFGMDAETAALFPDRLVESELGEIPEGWTATTIGDVCTSITSGGTPSTKKPEYWSGDLPWLSSGETRCKFIAQTEKRITAEGVENSSTKYVGAGATVIASAGQGKTRGQTSFLSIDSYINQSTIALVADKDMVSRYYLFFDLERRYEEFRRISDSHSSRGSLTTKLLAERPTVRPCSAVADRFCRVAESMVALILANLVESRTLAELRDLLLPKLLSGELRVKDAVRAVEAVA